MFLPAQSGGITTKDQKAKEALDAALKALGGADKIDGIKSLILKGSETAFPNGLFETWILLPDNFLHFRGPEADKPNRRRRDRSSISQGKTLQLLSSLNSAGTKFIRGDPETEEAIASVKATVDEASDTWSYLLMGMLAKSGPTPLALSSGLTPGIFILTKNDGITAEIEFDSITGYPSVIRYEFPKRKGEMRFSDRFSVNGVMFPRMITITTGNSWWDTKRQIEEVRINPNLGLDDFERFVELETDTQPIYLESPEQLKQPIIIR